MRLRCRAFVLGGGSSWQHFTVLRVSKNGSAVSAICHARRGSFGKTLGRVRLLAIDAHPLFQPKGKGLPGLWRPGYHRLPGVGRLFRGISVGHGAQAIAGPLGRSRRQRRRVSQVELQVEHEGGTGPESQGGRVSDSQRDNDVRCCMGDRDRHFGQRYLPTRSAWMARGASVDTSGGQVRRAHHLSASKTDLSVYCTFWARADTVVPTRPSGEKAVRGSSVHLAAERDHAGLPLPELDVAGAAMWATLKGWISSVPRFSHVELPLKYDAENDTASVCDIGPMGERDYLGITPMVIPAKLDLLLHDGSELVICEIKTGAKSKTAPAPENMQLRTQAVAAARYFGVDRVRVGIVFPMLRKVHAPEYHPLGPDELDAHAGRLHRVLRMLPDSQPNRGPHCWNCPLGPSKGYTTDCPAWQVSEQDTRWDGAA